MSGTRLTIRAYGDEDHARAFEWLQEPALRRCIGTTIAPTTETHWSWLQHMRARDDVRLYAVCNDDEHIGNLYLIDIDQVDKRAEVQIFIGDASRRHRGAGVLAVREALRVCFTELGLHRVYAYVFDYNEPALRMFAKAGFAVEGRLRDHRKRNGRFHDMIIVGCLEHHG